MRNAAVGYLLAGLALAACGEPQVDVKAKADRLQAKLEKVVTQDEFVRVAQASGLDCSHSTPGNADCSWLEPRKTTIASATPCGVVDAMISAHGVFVAGQKHGDYQVETSLAAC